MESNQKSARSLVEGESVKDFLRRNAHVKKLDRVSFRSKLYHFTIQANKNGITSDGYQISRVYVYDTHSSTNGGEWMAYPAFLRLLSRLEKLAVMVELHDTFRDNFHYKLVATAVYR